MVKKVYVPWLPRPYWVWAMRAQLCEEVAAIERERLAMVSSVDHQEGHLCTSIDCVECKKSSSSAHCRTMA